MKKNGVDQLVQKYLNEPGFRDKMKKDLEGTIKSSGITLNQEELATVRNVVMTTSDDSLRQRINKGTMN